jgi:L-asparaginase II
MTAAEGRIICKRGAEGFQIIGLLPGAFALQSRGVGIVFKVTYGDASRMSDDLEWSSRVRPAVAMEILKQLGALNEKQLQMLAPFGPSKILKNHRELVTGESHPAFKLKLEL